MNVNPELEQPAYTNFKPPRGWIRWIAVVIALVAWWVSLDLAKLSLGKPASNPWLQAECGAESGPDDSLDCQSVLNSARAWVPLSNRTTGARIPVATLGMGYFAFVGLWYLFVGSPTRSRWARHLLISAIVLGGAAVSAWMMHTMGNVLHKWCMGCVATHVLNGLLLLLTILAFPWRRDRAGVAPHPRGRLALATLAACAFLFLLHPAVTLLMLANNSAGRIYKAYNDIINDPEYIRWQYERQPVQPQLVGDQLTHAGDPAAPNTVVIFIDCQCPVCKSACALLEGIMEKHPGVVRVSCRQFPLDRSCNEGAPRSVHPVACRAARAIEAAGVLGGAEGHQKMLHLLHERADSLENAPYSRWAAELGLDADAFSKALESDEIAQSLRDDIELGQQLGVKALPTVFLNGRRLHHWSKQETWDALLGLPTSQESGDSPTP
jgi:protein-disulfide isomerase/uncharacterized membrane protein